MWHILWFLVYLKKGEVAVYHSPALLIFAEVVSILAAAAVTEVLLALCLPTIRHFSDDSNIFLVETELTHSDAELFLLLSTYGQIFVQPNLVFAT